MKSEIDLPGHRKQLKEGLLAEFSDLNTRKERSYSLKTGSFNWRTILASGVLTLLLVTGSLQLPFLNKGATQKVSAKEIVSKAKERYQEQNLTAKAPFYESAHYDRFSVWDYFPAANLATEDNIAPRNNSAPLIPAEAEFDEFGLFEVLDNYSETDFATTLITENHQEFYELELWQDGKKIKFLISPEDYALLQVDIFTPAEDNPQELIPRFSRRWP